MASIDKKGLFVNNKFLKSHKTSQVVSRSSESSDSINTENRQILNDFVKVLGDALEDLSSTLAVERGPGSDDGITSLQTHFRQGMRKRVVL